MHIDPTYNIFICHNTITLLGGSSFAQAHSSKRERRRPAFFAGFLAQGLVDLLLIPLLIREGKTKLGGHFHSKVYE